MKKILFSFLVLSLLVLSACGSPSGQVVKDTGKENSKQDTGFTPAISNSFTVESCSLKSSTAIPALDCVSGVINRDKISIKLMVGQSGYVSPSRIYLPKIGIDGCELKLDTSFENAIKYDESKVFEIPCKVESDIVDTDLIVEYIRYRETDNSVFDIGNEKGNFMVFDGEMKGYLSGTVR